MMNNSGNMALSTDQIMKRIPFQFDSLLRKINAFVFVFDFTDQKLLWVNEYVTDKLGYTAKELTSMNSEELMMLIHPDSRTDKIFNKSPKSIYIIKIKCKSGKWIWVIGCYNIQVIGKTESERLILGFGHDVDIREITNQFRRLEEQELNFNKSGIINTLSCRQMTVLSLIAKGKTDREIAMLLNISIHTAKTHRKTIIHKLGFKNSGTLINFAVENHLD